MNVIAIDPGYSRKGQGCACAYVGNDETGLKTWFARPQDKQVLSGLPFYAYVDRVIVEQPQQDSRSWSIPPAVLMQLSFEGAWLAGLYAGRCVCTVVPLTPSTSKGSVPKPIAHKRLWAQLTDEERDVLGGNPTFAQICKACERGALDKWSRAGVTYYPSTWLQHNILDAVDLGVGYLGR